MSIFLYCVCPFLGSFLVQFLLGCRTRFKVLRFIPLYCAAVTLIFAVQTWNASSLFIGLNYLAALIWGLIGVCILLGTVGRWWRTKLLGRERG